MEFIFKLGAEGEMFFNIIDHFICFVIMLSTLYI